jgi:lipopolysaccharide export system protein LptC
MHKEFRPSLAQRLGIGERTVVAVALLGAVAAVTQWLLWLQADPPVVDTFVGPPRSDYELGPFTMQSYNEDGSFAFSVKAPRLVREPFTKDYDIDAPVVDIRDHDGNHWNSVSHTGWISKDGKVIRLKGDVVADRLKSATVGPATITTQSLEADVDSNRMNSDDRVTVLQPGSILAGTGLDADLKAGTFVFRSDVKGHYEPSVKSP